MIALVIHFFSFLKISEASLAFNKRNIIIFLKKFESIYDNVNLKIRTKIKRVLEYYNDDIAREMKEYNM